jgi:hypothetical protein
MPSVSGWSGEDEQDLTPDPESVHVKLTDGWVLYQPAVPSGTAGIMVGVIVGGIVSTIV